MSLIKGSSHLPIWLVLALVLLVHIPTIGTSFCGFDDFNEEYRAKFEDTPEPSRILTTSHFGSFRYRPGNRILTWVCYLAGQGSAWPFRVRNLLAHLLNVYLIYLLVRRLFDDRFAASASALLFGLHHLVHQNIHAAIFTNTSAYALILLGLLASLSVADSPRWLLRACLAALATFFAIFTYEPALYAAGLLILYEACHWLFQRRLRTPLPRLLIHTALQAGAVISMGILRKAYTPTPLPEVTPLPVLLQILFSYVAAILIPFDTVSIQSLLDTSITKQLAYQRSFVFLLAGVLGLAAVAACWMAYRFGWYKRISRIEGTGLVFLAALAVLALLPTSLGSTHPSETYVYFATAASMPVLCLLAMRLLRIHENRTARILFLNSFWLLVVVFGFYDMTRSYMVIQCGNVSQRILSSLGSDPRIVQGAPLLVARSPYDPPLRHVGLYGYVGLDTIGVGPFAAAALRSGLSNTLNRTPIDAEVLSPGQLNATCAAAESKPNPPVCVYIHYDGYIEPWQYRAVF